MIIDFKASFNTYHQEIFGKYNTFDYICPSCGAKHSFIRHGSYERNICFIQDGKPVEASLTVLRLFCKSCNKTHAILPNDIIPYCIFSFSFILNVLIEKFILSKKISRICDSFNISFQMIFSFIARFHSFTGSCLYALKNLVSSITSINLKQILIALLSYQKVNNDFLSKYFFYSSWPFLMLKFQNILSRSIYVGGAG